MLVKKGRLDVRERARWHKGWWQNLFPSQIPDSATAVLWVQGPRHVKILDLDLLPGHFPTFHPSAGMGKITSGPSHEQSSLRLCPTIALTEHCICFSGPGPSQIYETFLLYGPLWA